MDEEEYYDPSELFQMGPVEVREDRVEEESGEAPWWEDYGDYDNWGQELLDNQNFGDPNQSDVFNLDNQAQLDLAAAQKALADAQKAAADKAKSDKIASDKLAADKAKADAAKKGGTLTGGSGGGSGASLGPKNPNPAAPAQPATSLADATKSLLNSILGNPQTGQKGILGTILGVTPIAKTPPPVTNHPNAGPVTSLPVMTVNASPLPSAPVLIAIAAGLAAVLR